MSRDHFVSQFHLRNFAVAPNSGEVWQTKRNKDGLFSVTRKTGTKYCMADADNDKPEHEGIRLNLDFRKIEDAAARVISEICRTKNTKALMSYDNRVNLCKFLSMQRLRQPFDHYLQSKKVSAIVEEVKTNWTSHGMTNREAAAFFEGNMPMLTEQGAKLHSMAMLSEVPFFYQEIFNSAIFLVGSSSKDTFLIGDSPLFTSRIYEGVSHDARDVAYVMPLSPDLTIVSLPSKMPLLMGLSLEITLGAGDPLDWMDRDYFGIISALASGDPYIPSYPESHFNASTLNSIQIDRAVNEIVTHINPKDTLTSSNSLTREGYMADFDPSAMVKMILQTLRQDIASGETTLTSSFAISYDGSIKIIKDPRPSILDVRFSIAASRYPDQTILILKVGPENYSVHCSDLEIRAMAIGFLERNPSIQGSDEDARDEIDRDELISIIDRYQTTRDGSRLARYIVEGIVSSGYSPIHRRS